MEARAYDIGTSNQTPGGGAGGPLPGFGFYAGSRRKHGRGAIVACREEKPTEYVKVVASLIPKELLVRKDPVDELSDQEIADALDSLRAFVARDRERTH